MSYEDELIKQFSTQYRLARVKAVRLRRIKTEEDLLKFTIRFAASWDAKYLTNFSKYVYKNYDPHGRYVTTIDLRECKGDLLKV